MNGAECLLRTLLAGGIDLCFMNPGTSEMQFVSAVDRVPAMRGVLCLFEGVCSGAADGYARMTRRPAATLLHLGPGLANGLSNFHNARKAQSPVVNIVGEHTTQHLQYNAPLTSDTAAFARTVSGWVRVLEVAGNMGEAAAAAVAAAYGPPGSIATLIVPADHSWSESGDPAARPAIPPKPVPDCHRVRAAAHILSGAEPAALLLGNGTLFGPALESARRIAAATGVPIYSDRYSARFEAGRGIFVPLRIPYFPEPAQALLANLKHLVLVETETPVSFFGYPGTRSTLAPPDCALHSLAAPGEDGPTALAALAEACGASASASAEPAPAPSPAPELPPDAAALTAETIGRVLAALLPAGAIISDEAVSNGDALWNCLLAAPPHDHLPVTGGSIGQGLPVALGAAFACPGRRVVALEADGSGMYTLQALWTMARHQLDVTVIVLANRRYRILDIEMRRTGAAGMGPLANDMVDLNRPGLDWLHLSEGLGVPAVRAATAGELAREFERAIAEPGPRLIEAVLAA